MSGREEGPDGPRRLSPFVKKLPLARGRGEVTTAANSRGIMKKWTFHNKYDKLAISSFGVAVVNAGR